MTNGYGQLLLACVCNYRMSLLQGSLPNDFLSSAFSKASCPQKRSSSAIFASADAGYELDGGKKASSPRCSYSFLQRETTLEARLCSRHTCAGRVRHVTHDEIADAI